MAKWTAADLPDLTGRTVVITGAGSGIGLITARELARAGARVVLGVRSVERAGRAIAGVADALEVQHLDIANMASVREFAQAWTGDLDVLINNAGVMDIPAARTADGFDVQTATNYLGPFVLTNLLLPHLTDRVVSVSSQLHRRSKLNVDDLDWRTRTYHQMNAYNDSKLAIVLFSLELQRRLKAAGSCVRSIVAHPGIATTALAAHSSANAINRLAFLLNDPEHGALPTLYAATQDLAGNAYVGPDGLGSVRGHPVVRKAGKAGRDEAKARQLWQASAALTGVGG